eukprot:TRINITY_DN42_c6_g1_i1.p1 TRINITY_DN42_c6_g1~~TRINITY_DN42_c6_g1_i1.p1  ORF type:complete len:556 (+),score=198.56 TRINITY_DN42_c6_g1_i1:44-1711(+)
MLALRSQLVRSVAAKALVATRAFGINFIDGEKKSHEIEIDEDVDHFQELLGNEGIELGVCGGEKVCGKCHVKIQDAEVFASLNPIDDEEEETLATLKNRTETSRLSCGIEITEDLDEVVIEYLGKPEKKKKKKKAKKAKKVVKVEETVKPMKDVNLIHEDIHWVGAVDWNLRDFHDYHVNAGGTYNSYLIKDEKNTLIDACKSTFVRNQVQRVKELTNGKLDYLVCNHAEMDHSSGMSDVVREFDPVIITNSRCKGALEKIYDTTGWKWQIVANGETVNIGSRDLQFLNTPMAHWPESMMTFDQKTKILFSMDAFGQHFASTYRFDDNQKHADFCDIFNEAKIYYANILYGLADPVQKALKGATEMFPEISMICPSHGVAWKKHIPEILAGYTKWSTGIIDPKVTIAYDTMYTSTERMAHAIYDGVVSSGDVDGKFMAIRETHNSDILTNMMESGAIALGSPTMHDGCMPEMGGLLTYMKGLFPGNHDKSGLAFGSYGWGPDGIEHVSERMDEIGFRQIVDPIAGQFRPNDDVLQKCYEAGQTLAQDVLDRYNSQ